MSNTNLNTWVGDNYSQLLVEQVAIMIEKEESFYTCVDYLGELPAESNGLIDEGWRQKAAEWMFKVIDFYVSAASMNNCITILCTSRRAHLLFALAVQDLERDIVSECRCQITAVYFCVG